MKGFFYSDPKKTATKKVVKEKSAGIKKGTRQVKMKEFKRFPEEEKKIKILSDIKEAILVLDSFYETGRPFCLDYETTGIQPMEPEHYIECISLCNSLKEAYCLPVKDFLSDEIFAGSLKRLLTSDVPKIAQNIKFESKWTYYILGYKLNNLFFDTMIASHILDNSTGITGLKYQSKKRYGIDGYEDGIAGFLKSPGDKKSGHAFNRIADAPKDLLYLYCGLDSLLTYRLYRDQKKEIDPFRKIGFDFFMEGIRAFANIELNGMTVDLEKYKQVEIELDSKLEKLKDAIYDTAEVKQWDGKEKFNFSSTNDLRRLLYTILGYTPPKVTEKGSLCVDKESLQSLRTPFTELLLEYRRFFTIRNTFLAQFIRESSNEKIYPTFNLHTVATYRSSSTAPNFQNIPKRDEEAQKYIRTGLIPSKGNQLLEVDYSGVEVRISACMHKDPEMIKYIEDPTTDMHRDVAIDLFMIKGECPKKLRQAAKNGFVFPQFYGDYYKNCATNMWYKWLDADAKAELKVKGIKNYNAFERQVRKVEDIFWNQRFKKYTVWKDKMWERYQREHIIKLKTGFIAISQMRKNEALNIPIQGPAFHCLLWSLIQMEQWLSANKMKTKIIGQIHDAMVLDVFPPELEKVKVQLKKIMCKDILKHYDWIIVPLDVEMEVSAIDGNWAEMEKIKN